MRRDLRVMDDPVLDRIFSEAYRDTLKQVDTLEQQKSLKDRYDALAELFERDLYSRDLSHQERQEFVQIFREYIATAEERVAERKEMTRRTIGISVGGSLLALVLAASILIGVYRPFTSETKVTDELNMFISKVDEGYGEYSKKYYRTLDKYQRKLGPEKVADFEESMYTVLDAGFGRYLTQLEEGEIALYDDTREWANYFPDREERKARRQLAQNALVAGFGGAMGKAAESVIQGVKGLVGKGADIVKERAAEIGRNSDDSENPESGSVEDSAEGSAESSVEGSGEANEEAVQSDSGSF